MANEPTLSPLKQALLVIERLEARVKHAEAAAHEPIAVLGMGCRFPGGADDPHGFWEVLRAGRDATQEVPRARWNIDDWYAADPDTPGKMYIRRGGFLEDVASFDAAFFGIAPRAAAAMDPQHRLLLEVAWQAIEDAAISPSVLRESDTGVFVGITSNEYSVLLLQEGGATGFDGHCVLGGPLFSASGRLSYTLGLHGPSMSIDTACSSSLSALHLACQSLRSRESRWALAAGVNLLLVPELTAALCRTGALAPDGRCKSFSAAANGFARGEGCGVLMLARLSDALADGYRVRAILRSSGVNHDGASSGYTVPNGRAQEALIRKVWQDARVTPAEVDYVEAHGTGTPLGDPVEMRALVGVLGQTRPRDRPLLVGSAKTNFGHCESAAGVAGVMKVILALENGELPPHLHCEQPSPHIAWDEFPVRVTRERTPWQRGEKRRLAGVSSFGLGGTNGHVLLEEAPLPPVASAAMQRPWHLLILSARTEAALREQARRLHAHLAAHPEQRLADVAYTLAVGRAPFAQRAVVRAADMAGALTALAALAAGQRDPALQKGRTADPPPRVGFLFAGAGAERVGMGRALSAVCATFRDAFARCDALFRPHLPASLRDVLWTAEAGGQVDARFVRPALFAFGYALAATWQGWGIVPRAVAGHDVGAITAACVAGAITLDQATALVVDPEGAAPQLASSDPTAPLAYFAHPDDLAQLSQLLQLRPMGQESDAWSVLCADLAALYVKGCPLDAKEFYLGLPVRRVSLPTYPFERRSYWIADAIAEGKQSADDAAAPHASPAAPTNLEAPAPAPSAVPAPAAAVPSPENDLAMLLAEQLRMVSTVLTEQLRLLANSPDETPALPQGTEGTP